MSNPAICDISVALNINCNNKEAFSRFLKFAKNKLQEIWNKLRS